MNIKILTSYHKKCALVSSEIIRPIQVGTSINGTAYSDTLHDNTGINISDKNRMYCELTAQYWAWKNLEADYYGFMHYRRYFCFSMSHLNEDQFGNVLLPYPDEQAIKKLHLSDAEIEKVVMQYDLICTAPQDTKELGQGATVYEHYKRSPYHRIKDFDLVLSIIRDKYPEFVDATRKYINGHTAYFCNMYIMKKNIFHEYSKWLFDILEEHEKRTNFNDYDIDEYRVSGFLAERLWGIYYTWLKENREYKILETQRSFFTNTEENEAILPAFEKGNIPVVLAADNKYVPYVTTLLRSIIDNANQEKNYDFVILNSNISDLNKEKIKREFVQSTNMSIRFANVKRLFAKYDLYVHRHFTVEIYYRLFMQDIMKHYDKVIYLDSDIIMLDDVSKLCDIELGDNYLAAVQDVDSAGCYNGVDSERKKYHAEYMKMKNPYDYFNSGVLVMNLVEFRRNFTAEHILELAASKKWLFPDQDVLNILCEGKVHYLDMSWNVMMNWKNDTSCRIETAKRAPYWLYLKYLKSRKEPKIVHYAGFQKPWDTPDCDYAEYFWKYAKETSVYEKLITKEKEKTLAFENENVNDPYLLHINGLDEPLYIDGLYIKMINKLNKWFPKNSSKREKMKRVVKHFVH